MKEAIAKYLDSRQPFVLVNTVELDRFEATLRTGVEHCNKEMLPQIESLPYVLTDGFKVKAWKFGKGWTDSPSAKEYIAMLQSIKSMSGTVCVVRNFGYIWENRGLVPQLVELLIDLYNYCIENYVYIFFVGKIGNIPQEVQPYFSAIDGELPSEKDLKNLAMKIIKQEGIDCASHTADSCALALKGLTLVEAEKAMNIAIIHGTDDAPINFEKLYAQKAEIVKKSELLEYIKNTESLESLGGMEEFKEHYKTISAYYKDRDRAKAYGLQPPRGCLSIGVQGCGKSLSAKVVAKMFNLQLFRWDVGQLYGSLVGESEDRTRRTLKVIKAVSPAVILVDEAEKMFAGYQSSAQTSGGVVNRVLAEILYFMEEENTDGAFFFFTSNSIDDLPPELIRAGRLDDIWFVDMPNIREREEIFKIHIAKSGRDPKNYKTPIFASASEGFTGSDIASVIKRAMFSAFVRNKEYSSEDVLEAIKVTTPFYVTHKDTVEKLRVWAKHRAKPVSNAIELTQVVNKRLVRKGMN